MDSQTEQKQSESKKRGNRVSTSVAIVLAGILISGAIVYSRNTSSGALEYGNGNLPIPEVTDDDFIFGDTSAKVTIIEYADFSCSFCAAYHPTMKKIAADFDGGVRWVFRHLPIFNKPAAIASSCVGNILGDDKFFEYADILFANQKDLNQELMRLEAVSLGVLADEYDACINDVSLSDKISRDFSMARILAGINATPHSILIDSKGKMYPFSGALSYEDVKSLVETVVK